MTAPNSDHLLSWKKNKERGTQTSQLNCLPHRIRTIAAELVDLLDINGGRWRIVLWDGQGSCVRVSRNGTKRFIIANIMTAHTVIAIEAALSRLSCDAYICAADSHNWIRTPSASQTWIHADATSILNNVVASIPHEIDGMQLVGVVVERTSCFRYEHAQCYAVHTDEPYRGTEGSIAKLILVIYLNDNFTGGETYFPDHDLEVKPVAGLAIAFRPDLPHGTRPVLTGTKYILRTELAYGPASSGETAKRAHHLRLPSGLDPGGRARGLHTTNNTWRRLEKRTRPWRNLISDWPGHMQTWTGHPMTSD